MTANTQPIASRQKVLIDVARRLSSTLDLVELIDHILQRSREVMDCEVCSILLPDGPDESLLIRSTLDPQSALEVRVPKGKGIAGAVFASKKTLNIADATNDARHFRPDAAPIDLIAHAMVAIPLLDGERCLGVMQALNPNHGGSFDAQDVEIFETFGSLIAVTLLRLESQKKAIQEVETRQQLSMAAEIQNSFLPAPFVQMDEVVVESFYQPASEVGGDFYFWHRVSDGKILAGVGDVSGNGLPAALDMARAATLVASTAHLCTSMSLAEWVSELNQKLCDVMKAGRFIALSALLLCPKTRRVSLCCAGLPNAQVFDGTTWREVTVPGNVPLGISRAARYTEHTPPMRTDRQWLIFSDGILEARNKAGEYFEDHAFAAVLRDVTYGKSALQRLVERWRSFTAGPAHHDDATALLVSYHAAPPADEITLSCQPDNLGLARSFIESWASWLGMPDDVTGLIVLGCDEVMSNLCKYAYCAADGGAEARCRVESHGHSMRILITHHGEGITNEEFARLASQPSATGERIGGLGLHVIREVFDHVDFRRDEHQSVIELVKSLP